LKLRITANLQVMPVETASASPAEKPTPPKPTTTVPSLVESSSSSTYPKVAENFMPASAHPSGMPPSLSSASALTDYERRRLKRIVMAFMERNRQKEERELAFRTKQATIIPAPVPYTSWSVFCNHCDKSMENEHYHCSVCDLGDYDLCDACVNAGIHCPGEGHWLVKRFVSNGTFINSQTRKLPPRLFKSEAESVKEMPGTFTEDKQPTVEDEKESETDKPQPSSASQSTYAAPLESRTCNSCIVEYPERMFVTCTDCDDYDICEDCHLANNGGHHPAHILKPVDSESASFRVKSLCGQNRSTKHNALCDGCDRVIYGVRHKCLNCPDWDYCSECVKNAHIIHPTHRFAKVYEKLPDVRQVSVRHTGIYCDGPLCKDKTRSYIEGVRYKCAVCHDTDFCGNCEASPVNRHNRTHPLIKFKTPVRNVSVTTMNEDQAGSPLATLGDRPYTRQSRASEASVTTQNAASPVQTVYETKPSAEASSSKTNSKIDIKDLLTGNEQDPLEKLREQVSKVAISEPLKPQTIPAADLNAVFVRDTVPDATKVLPAQRFVQTWTLRNPGPHAWPLGCSVRFVGGDHMLNVTNPTGADKNQANESNVISRTVQPGEEVDFRVLMKAPERKGAAISYWRLKNADGEAFGHKLWCHVIVETPATETAAQYFFPPTPVAHPATQNTSWPSMTPAQQESLRQFNSIPPVQRFEAYRSYVREARARLAAEHLAKQASKNAEKEEAAEEIKPAAEEKKEESQPTEKEPEKEDAKPVASQMIFPTLEKESPVGSIHESTQASSSSATVQPTTETIASPLPSTVAPSERAESELFEDAETVDFIDSASDSEGFVTDEEWDVLGASDEETM
jgi:next to BRCA1 gene 1 protein